MEISIREARDTFTQLVKTVESGEVVTITRDGVPVATLQPVATASKPVFGTMKGKIIVDPKWNRPQNDVEAWLEGEV